ncbi:TetR family transcriptional regulator [Ureibacillus xyleni]|uniref:TetR family transcriptional regulator n=1 Tax=Ureibacillus xyleni TaxID=614648 RepID=A0A285RYK9_9BACL|nr:TetR-like C-terminal domain-containing protein [Ureibacillus xyleni]SOB99690.1 TetR family transcriptional regulator [Ureibacillus xyleni]
MSPRVGLDQKMIIKVAAELADVEGIESITLSNIAKKLNVRPPSLFNHIQGLPSIKKELALLGMAKLFETLKDAAYNKTKDEAIIALAYAYVTFANEHPGLYQFTIKAPDTSEKELEDASNQIIALLNDILSDYGLSYEDKIHAIRTLRSILHGFSALEQMGAFGLQISIKESLQIMVEGYIQLLKRLAQKNTLT